MPLNYYREGKVDFDKQKIVQDLVTLSESIKPLRKLLHRQIKDLLLELQAQIKNTKSKSNPKAVHDNPPSQDDRLAKTQPSPSESEDLAHEALHDSNEAAPDDFEELERELRVLTQPSFEQDAVLPMMSFQLCSLL